MADMPLGPYLAYWPTLIFWSAIVVVIVHLTQLDRGVTIHVWNP